MGGALSKWCSFSLISNIFLSRNDIKNAEEKRKLGIMPALECLDSFDLRMTSMKSMMWGSPEVPALRRRPLYASWCMFDFGLIVVFTLLYQIYNQSKIYMKNLPKSKKNCIFPVSDMAKKFWGCVGLFFWNRDFCSCWKMARLQILCLLKSGLQGQGKYNT